MTRDLMREATLPEGLHDAGIVLTGAIIVYDGNNRCVASHIPGTLWPGSLALPDDYLLDNLPNTTLQTREDLTLEHVITAAQQHAIWTAIFGIEPRVLTALDALGGKYQGVQHELARVCGISRERLNKRLGSMVSAGKIERTRNGSQGDLLEIPAHHRGRYWQANDVQANVQANVQVGFKSLELPNLGKPRPVHQVQVKPASKPTPVKPVQVKPSQSKPSLKQITYQNLVYQNPLFNPEALHLEHLEPASSRSR